MPNRGATDAEPLSPMRFIGRSAYARFLLSVSRFSPPTSSSSVEITPERVSKTASASLITTVF